MDRLHGTVKWFSAPKGYGFVTLPDGREAFVHYTAIEGSGFRKLEEGEEIELSLIETEMGLKAREVIRLGRTGAGGVPRGEGGFADGA